MFNNTKIITTTLIALSLSMGLSACSPAQNNVTPPPTSASATASNTANPTASADATPTESAVPSETASDTTDSPDSAQTAEAANARINDFMAAIKADALALNADPAAKAAAMKSPEAFDQAFANSISFIDTSKFSNNKVEEIVDGFASIYMMDSEATIISKSAESMKMSGDTATIEGNAFTLTMKGTEQKGSSGSGGAMVLTFADGEWKITGWVDGPSSK